MLQFAGDELPRARNRWTERVLIGDAFNAYLDWRHESAEVWHAYKRWNSAPAREARGKYWAYRAALEREEHAARVYRRLASRLEARARERAETPRRSHLVTAFARAIRRPTLPALVSTVPRAEPPCA